MNTEKLRAVQATRTEQGESHVKQHELLFRFRLVSVNGMPVTEDSSVYRELSRADDVMYDKLPHQVTNWRFRDEYEVDCDRLEVYQPEFDEDTSAEGPVRLYCIAIAASRELPDLAEQATPEHPLSVQSLVNEVPGVLQALYAEYGIVMELYDIGYRKNLESSDSGTISLL